MDRLAKWSVFITEWGKLLARRLNRFILPTEAVQASAIRQAAHCRLAREIAQNVRGNASMMIGVAVALAAPMLSLLGRGIFWRAFIRRKLKGEKHNP